MHSKKYEQIKAAYERGSYTLTMMQNLVHKGWITETEYIEITGKGI